MQLLLDAVTSRGPRLARPGEFTERAFLCGKLDLVQAEAVADLISSASEAAARGALRSLQGAFSGAVNALDEQLLSLRVLVEAAMDFPEEEVDFLSENQVGEQLETLCAGFSRLIEDSEQGILLRDGITIALVGEPNVGKSSLLNALSGVERAIVTDVPGTTRDLIHADLVIDGLPIQVVDTAGLRETDDRVEMEGVKRAREQASSADLVLVVMDDRTAGDVESCPLLAELQRPPVALIPRRILRVLNKADLSGRSSGVVLANGPQADIQSVSVSARSEIAQIRLSALQGAGVEALKTFIKSRVGFTLEGAAFTARKRHLNALGEGLAALDRARGLVAETASGELVAEELRDAHQALGSIVGEVTPDELLGEIFANFCIGK
jgi:tRNA modification GTPase